MRFSVLVAAALVLSACGLSRGPWVDEYGQRLQGSQLVEYDGFASCDQERVVFIAFFGDTYAKDPLGRLGELRSLETGEPVTFASLTSLPPSAEATGITGAGREIFVADDRTDYLYIRLLNGTVERWPRAEVPCGP